MYYSITASTIIVCTDYCNIWKKPEISRFQWLHLEKTSEIVVGDNLLLLKKHFLKSLATIAYELNIEKGCFDYFTLRPGLVHTTTTSDPRIPAAEHVLYSTCYTGHF